jgi:hypothetical protein
LAKRLSNVSYAQADDPANRQKPVQPKDCEAELSANADKAAERSPLSAFSSIGRKWRCYCNPFYRRTRHRDQMTLKIEKYLDGNKLTIRLTGRMQEEHLEDLKALVNEVGPNTVLNLGNLNLVGVEVVRFLAKCERAGIEINKCSPYIRNWINRELDRTREVRD